MATPKTSQSHPLRIDSVTPRDLGEVIGMTFCPGKKHRGAYSGDWDRDLLADLEAIKAFGAKALVTLMESNEMAAVGVPATQLGSKAAEFGLEWHHLPIKDVHVPDDRFADSWTYSGLRLRALLRCRDRIVIHCLGGLGRTGTIAGRLLVEFGDTPEAAIRKVREARPGSIETRGQEEYVNSCKPAASARESRSREEKVLACLLGGALGDAFGYAVEFSSMDSIRKHFGPLGITEPVFQDGKLIVSDDTQMTLFTLEGLLHCLGNRGGSEESCLESIRLAYLNWLGTQGGGPAVKGGMGPTWLAAQPEMLARRAPGNTCISALNTGGRGTIRQPINDSKGCGGVMRVAPIGLVREAFEPEVTFKLAAAASALTHGHPSGYLSAGMMASVVRFLAEGADLKSATGRGCELLKGYARHEETLHAVNKALILAESHPKDRPAAIETLGGGWVGEEALAIALFAALSAETFVEVVRIAVNHSGDSDSTASIAGQLWGAMNGLDGMPHGWVSALDVLAPLLNLARQLLPRL